MGGRSVGRAGSEISIMCVCAIDDHRPVLKMVNEITHTCMHKRQSISYLL